MGDMWIACWAIFPQYVDGEFPHKNENYKKAPSTSSPMEFSPLNEIHKKCSGSFRVKWSSGRAGILEFFQEVKYDQLKQIGVVPHTDFQ